MKDTCRRFAKFQLPTRFARHFASFAASSPNKVMSGPQAPSIPELPYFESLAVIMTRSHKVTLVWTPSSHSREFLVKSKNNSKRCKRYFGRSEMITTKSRNARWALTLSSRSRESPRTHRSSCKRCRLHAGIKASRNGCAKLK